MAERVICGKWGTTTDATTNFQVYCNDKPTHERGERCTYMNSLGRTFPLAIEVKEET